MRKHLIAAAIAGVCLAGLTACEQNTANKTDNNQNPSAPATQARADNDIPAAPLPADDAMTASNAALAPGSVSGDETPVGPDNTNAGPMLADAPPATNDGSQQTPPAPNGGGMPPSGAQGNMLPPPPGGISGGQGNGSMNGQTPDMTPAAPSGNFSGSAVMDQGTSTSPDTSSSQGQ